jgi:hypothetical protein
LAGATSSSYPAGNFTPIVSAWQAAFVNYSFSGGNTAQGPADYHILATSSFHNAATDGTDLGADIDAVNTAISGVVSGTGGQANPLSITTSALASATQSTAYSATVVTTGGTAPITFSISSGSLPTGLSLNTSTGTISGTPSVQGTSAFTVRAVDSGSITLSASQALSIVVQAPLATLSITQASPLTAGSVNAAYTQAISLSGDRAPYAWSVTAGALPSGVTLGASTGILTGRPGNAGVFTFTLQVLGAAGGTASKAFSLTIAAEVLSANRPVIAVNNNLWSGNPAPTLQFNYTEAQVFRRATAPSLTTDAVALGDMWIDTSTTAPTLKTATAVTPLLVWTAVGSSGAGGGHAMLSATHTDTIPDTPQEGDLIVGTTGGGPGQWHRLGRGTQGQVLTSTANSVGWAVPSQNSSYLALGGNALAAPLFFGTTDAQPALFRTNNIDRMVVLANGNTYFNSSNASELNFSLEIDKTADSYSVGMSTANGRKATLHSLQGTLQQALVFGDASASTDYVFGVSTSQDTGATWTPYLRVRQDGFVNVKSLTLDTQAAPTCDAAHRGQFNYVAGGSGVKDIVQVCAKDVANAYAWRTIY